MARSNARSGAVRLVLPSTNQPPEGEMPAFPEIPMNYPGFCMPHLQCGGLREDTEPHERILVGLHELLHWQIADALLPEAFRVGMIKTWDGIIDLAAGRLGEDLQVPIDLDRVGGDLAQAIASVNDLAAAMETLQEVFAISVSLHLAEESGVLTPIEAERQRSNYVDAYWEYDGFSWLYPRFEDAVKRHGYEAAVEIARTSLHTPSPTSTCEILIDHVNRSGPDARLEIPIEDPDFAEWHRGHMQDMQDLDYGKPRRFEFEDYRHSHLLYEYFREFALTPFIFRVYDEGWVIGGDVEIPEIAHMVGLCKFLPEDRPRTFPWAEAVYTWLFYESLRQQLMTGVGLQCPFWYSAWNLEREPRRCCADEDRRPRRREILEGLLAHTRGPNTWCPRGCLLRENRSR